MQDRIGQRLGNYQLLRVLGQGSFASVYLGEHCYLEKPAAIKVLHMQIEQTSYDKFRQEARTIAHLQHPHILTVYDFGIDNQTPYLVMEYTPNGTLRSRHSKGTRLSFEQILHYVRHIAPALDYAHEHHVIHRDIKPENLLLNAKNEVLLSDFGLAIVQHTLDSLSSQNPAGTPIYMAPEQFQRKPCAASDQYALGILVYEWLCGKPPFLGTLYEIFGQHLHEPPPSLCAQVPNLPAAVEDAVFGALSKEPSQRFSTTVDFATVLEEAFLATQPRLPQIFIKGSTQQIHPTHGSDETVLTPHSLPTEEQIDSNIATQPSPSSKQISTKPTKSTDSLTNRNRLLRRVHAFWIAGVLEHSLHGAALMALGLQEQSDALVNPWHLMYQAPQTIPHNLPRGTSITEVYDSADGELLILGAPGSGKTTLLLELARTLLDRAERDQNHPLPVVFNLSSWAVKPRPLADWFIEEFANKYQVPRKLGKALVETDQLLPLLDGLDEVTPKERGACIEAINTYRQEHGLSPIVISCRKTDYMEQTKRIQLRSAVTIQPLSKKEIGTYLQSAGSSVKALSAALRSDPDLQELATTPLMLNILILAYQGIPFDEITLLGSLADKQQQVFAIYVQRMLKHRNTKTPYQSHQILRWLTSLAKQMKQDNQTVFYLEQMRPDWLKDHRLRRMYEYFAVILPSVLISMILCFIYNVFVINQSNIWTGFDIVTILLFGGAMGLVFSPIAIPISENKKKSGIVGRRWNKFASLGTLCIIVGLIFIARFGLDRYNLPTIHLATILATLKDLLLSPRGMIVALSGILFTILIKTRKTKLAQEEQKTGAQRNRWRSLVKGGHVKNGVFLWILLSVCNFSVLLPMSTSHSTLATFYTVLQSLVANYPINEIQYGLLVILLSLVLTWIGRTIQPAEIIVWSWKSLGRSLINPGHLRGVLLVGFLLLNPLLSEFISSAADQIKGGSIHNMLSTAFANGGGAVVGMPSAILIYWFLLGLFQGISSDTLDEQHRITPNQGIQQSIRNSLLIGLISGCLGTFIYIGNVLFVGKFSIMVGSWVDSIIISSVDVLRNGICVGLLIALLIGLLIGGLACLRHYILRWLLWRADSMPWNYPRFLDDASERILLRKVGGGYIFVHRLLLEYFATLEYTEQYTPVISRRVALAGLLTTGAAAIGGGLIVQRLAPQPFTTISGDVNEVSALNWSPDSQNITSFDTNNKLQTWDVTTGALVSTYTSNSNFSNAAKRSHGVQWSPDNKLAAIINKTRIQVINPSTGIQSFTYPLVQNGPGIDLIWAPDSKSIAIINDTKRQIFEASTGTPRFSFTAQAGFDLSIRWSPDSKSISIINNSTLQIVEALTGSPRFSFTVKANQFGGMDWSPDSKSMMIDDGTSMYILDTSTGIPRFSLNIPHNSYVDFMEWSPDSQNIVIKEDFELKILDTFTGIPRFSFTRHPSIDNIYPLEWSVIWSPNTKYIAIVSVTVMRSDESDIGDMTRNTALQILDASSYKSLFPPIESSPDFQGSWQWSPDSKSIIGYGSNLQVWDASNGSIRYSITDPFLSNSSSLPIFNNNSSQVWSPDGENIAFAGDDGTIRIYNIEKRSQVAYWDAANLLAFPADKALLAIAWSPDGRFIASGNGRGQIQIWNTK